MRLKTKIASLATILTIFCILLIPLVANALAIKTTVGDILSNPDKYDGKMVQVEGKVASLKFKTSKKGNPYTTLNLSDAGNTLTVFSFGTLSIKEEERVRVMGKYQKIKQVGRYTFYNEIDASEGSVEGVK